MARNSPFMGIRIWNNLIDKFNHSELEANWDKVDAHDHTSGKGKQIPSGGIADNSVTQAKIADAQVSAAKLTAPVASTLTNARVPTGPAGGFLSGTYPDPTVTTEAAHTVTAPTGWTFSDVRYWKDPLGVVHLGGSIQRNNVADSNITAFTLPTGYFSTTRNYFLSATGGPGSGGFKPAIVNITTTGGLFISLDVVSGSAYADLDGLSFHPGR